MWIVYSNQTMPNTENIFEIQIILCTGLENHFIFSTNTFKRNIWQFTHSIWDSINENAYQHCNGD